MDINNIKNKLGVVEIEEDRIIMNLKFDILNSLMKKNPKNGEEINLNNNIKEVFNSWTGVDYEENNDKIIPTSILGLDDREDLFIKSAKEVCNDLKLNFIYIKDVEKAKNITSTNINEFLFFSFNKDDSKNNFNNFDYIKENKLKNKINNDISQNKLIFSNEDEEIYNFDSIPNVTNENMSYKELFTSLNDKHIFKNSAGSILLFNNLSSINKLDQNYVVQLEKNIIENTYIGFNNKLNLSQLDLHESLPIKGILTIFNSQKNKLNINLNQKKNNDTIIEEKNNTNTKNKLKIN